jgi:hypothetical protein
MYQLRNIRKQAGLGQSRCPSRVDVASNKIPTIDHTVDADSPYLLTLTVRLPESDADVYPAIAIAQLGLWETDHNPKASVAIQNTGTSPIATVTTFYEALSRGDGNAATGYVVPESVMQAHCLATK